MSSALPKTVPFCRGVAKDTLAETRESGSRRVVRAEWQLASRTKTAGVSSSYTVPVNASTAETDNC